MNLKSLYIKPPFSIYGILIMGCILFLFKYPITLQNIVINVAVVSGIVFATKFLESKDSIVISIAIIVLMGYTSYLSVMLGSNLQNIEQLANLYGRVQLFFASPNFLAVFLITSSTSTLILLKYVPRYHFLLPILFLLIEIAIIFTGSRISLIICIFLFSYLYLGTLHLQKRMVLWSLFTTITLNIAAFSIIYFLNQESQTLMTSPNLLKESEDFMEYATPYKNATIIKEKRDNQALPSKHDVTFIKATSPENTGLFFLHTIKISTMDEYYVASVSLKSDTPQKIRLSTQLSSIICDTNTNWSRCTTPAGKGDNYAALQFRFETLEPNQYVEFYFAEPQLEIGKQATPYQPRANPSRIYLLSQRLSQNIFSKDNLTKGFLAGRPEAWSKGWRLFLQRPLFGIGSGNFTKYEDTEITHSHNIFIQILATQGLVGFAMWFAVGFIMLSSMTARQRRDFFPMLMVAFLMNLTDYTFIHASSLYVFFFTWGCVYFNKIYPEAENKELVSG